VSDLIKLAAAAGLALLALGFVFGAQVSASDPSCAATTSFIPQFCVNMPVGTSVRRETTIPLAEVLTAGAEVRVEAGVPAPEVLRLASTVDVAIARVERALERPFTTKPRILIFATRASFARGTRDLFGYSPATAATVATSYGGVFDPQTLTIAISWESTVDVGLADILAHELTHLATREIVGHDAVLPTWFEEGLAARIQAGEAAVDEDARLAARSLLASAPATLDTIDTLADWHRAYARIGVALYAVSAEAVGAIEAQIGHDATVGLLAAVGAGTSFDDAYRARGGEAPGVFLARFIDALALRPTLTIGTVADDRGNLRWTVSAFAPNTDVRITISGKSYDLAFTVRTDAIGMYRGTFGSTAAFGAYTLTASNATSHATASLETDAP
jgi:hypothetical protein